MICSNELLGLGVESHQEESFKISDECDSLSPPLISVYAHLLPQKIRVPGTPTTSIVE